MEDRWDRIMVDGTPLCVGLVAGSTLVVFIGTGKSPKLVIHGMEIDYVYV